MSFSYIMLIEKRLPKTDFLIYTLTISLSDVGFFGLLTFLVEEHFRNTALTFSMVNLICYIS